MKIRNILAIAIFASVFTTGMAQKLPTVATEGDINYPGVPIVTTLNPDGDGWTTSCSCGYVIDDQTESEIPWQIIPSFEGEPTGDNTPGGPCGTADIVDNFTFNGAGYKHLEDPDAIPDNGDETFMFRLRTGTEPGGNFGFSVLMDINMDFNIGALGCPIPDPDFVVGNPGFEIEIRAKNNGGGKGVYLDDVSLFPVVTNVGFYAMGTNIQRSEALYGNFCGSPAFYDLAVPWIDMMTAFGMWYGAPVRLGVATTVAGETCLPNLAVDIGGIDNDMYPTDDSTWITLICNQTPITLAVDFINFNAELNSNDDVELVWSTATETNNDFFTVERSRDGLKFEELLTVPGVGNSNTINIYEAMDNDPLPGASYYRIKQTDINGDFSYSKLDAVNRNKGVHVVSTFPNPADDVLHVILGSWEDRNVTLEIVNTIGQVAHGETIALNEGSNQLHINVSSLSNGIYMLGVTSEDGNYHAQQQIVKASH